MTEQYFMLRAMVGMCSQSWMPVALVLMGLNGPFVDCPGLGSQVSMWLGPPASQSRITESHLAMSFGPARTVARSMSIRFMPRNPNAPAFNIERRLRPDFPSQSMTPLLTPVANGRFMAMLLFSCGSHAFRRTELRSVPHQTLNGAGAPFYFTNVNSRVLNNAQYTSSIQSRCALGSVVAGEREQTDCTSLLVGMRVSTERNKSCAICCGLSFASSICLI